jgi:hypothetical protein
MQFRQNGTSKIQALKAVVAASLDSGPSIPADEVFDRLIEKYSRMWLDSK